MAETQFNSKTLENHLQSLFTPQIRNRGLALADDGAVQEVFLDEKSGVINGTVKAQGGSDYYKQELVVNDKNRFLSSANCSCPYGKNCKHAAAVLYHMLNNDIDVVDPSNPNAGALEKGSDKFRFLPNDQPLIKSLDLYSYSNNSLAAHEKELKLFEDNSIQMKCFERQAYYLGGGMKEVADVTFTRENGALGIKCNSCHTATHKLCKHQKLALEQFIYEVDEHDYLKERLNYEQEADTFANDLGISRDIFLSSYEMRLKLKKVLPFKINDSLYESEEIETLMKRLIVIQNPLTDKAVQTIEKEETMGNALYWTTDYKEDLFFNVLQGRYNKAKDRISAKIEAADFPRYFSEGQLSTFQSMNALQFGIRQKKMDAINDLKRYVHDNVDEVNAIFHYMDEENTYPAIGKGALPAFSFSLLAVSIDLTVHIHDIGYELKGQVKIGEEIKVFDKGAKATPLFCVIDKTAYFYQNPEESTIISEFLKKPELLFSKRDETAFFELIQKLSNISSIRFSKEMNMEEIIKSGGDKKIYLKEVSNFIIIEPYIEFKDCRFNVLTQSEQIVDKKKLKLDEEDRQEYLSIIKDLHPNFDISIIVQDYLYLKVEEMLDKLWFLDFYDACRANDIEVFGQESLTKLNFSPHRGSVSNYIKSGIDWFDVNVEMTFGEQTVSTLDWVRAIKDNQKYVQLDDGTLGLIPEEWVNKLKRLVQTAEVSKDGVKISKFKFNVIDELFDNIDDDTIIQELREKKKKLIDYDYRKQFNLPEGIQADLRPYQESGYQWLKTLDEIKWGGILADDMGLGKTLQVISMLTEVHKTSHRCSLVVVPRSLIFNWVNELDKFSPNLKYLIHYGLDRNVDQDKFYEYDLIITTYTLVANDIRSLSEIQFEYIILDESQAIKNITSQRYRAVCLLKSMNRFCMTGTPIENNTFELYAQMNFVNPGMLGGQKAFKDLYAQPIDAQGDEAAATMLKKIINPFLLRRTKEVVAKDLPDKTETVIYCEMGKAQRRMYDDIKSQIRQDIQGQVAQQGLNKSKMKILEGLLRLRQICNSPLLVKSDLPKSQQDSIKIDTLIEQLIDELKDHNALVFSQFTSMLNLIRKELDKRGVRYSYLDGSTRKRKEVVEEFNEDDEIQIFLISLKAGNTGLNLVKADYVYIVDPWWNPAVEAQAIDRTHRIGQDKSIFAYKLVCKDTIEEKILKLQERKKKIATDIISTEDNIMKSMNKDELLALFD